MAYTVFITGWHDRLDCQTNGEVDCGDRATPFIDIFDLRKGDRIEAKILQGFDQASELIAFLTPVVGGSKLGMGRNGPRMGSTKTLCRRSLCHPHHE